jgi:hypothetical protein
MNNLGVPQLIPHIPWLIEVGDADESRYGRKTAIVPSTVDIMNFSTNLLKEMCVRVERAQKSKSDILVKLHSLM